MCTGVYAIIHDKEKGFLVAKYADGIGLIGGRVNNEESLLQAMRREIQEEVYIAKLKSIRLTSKTQEFDSTRCPHPEKRETHRFFIVELGEEPQKGNIEFEWLSKEEFLSKIPFPNRRMAIAEIINGEINENM